MVTINVDQEKCTGCGTCVTTCPVGVYELRKASNYKKSFSVNADQCIVCMACEAVCPTSTINVIE